MIVEDVKKMNCIRTMSVCLFISVGRDGFVCISILHEPGDDKYGYESASERWLPVHTVETIMVGYSKVFTCN